MNEPSAIEHVVMRRVHTIRLLRPLLSGGALAALLFAAALWGIGREVWVARVFANAPRTLAENLRFYAYAFAHTRVLVQALALLSLASVVYLARAAGRLLAPLVSPRASAV